MRSTVVLVYVAVSVLWGSTWLVIAIGLTELPPLLFAGLRMALAAALLTPFALRGGVWRELVGPLRGRVVMVGVAQIALPYGLMFVAQRSVPSGLAAMLFATFPVWIVLLARLLLPGEWLGPARLLSAALGIAGVAVLEAPHLVDLQASRALAVGSALIVAASMVVALANVLARRHLTTLSPLALTTGQTWVGAALLLSASGLLEAGQPATFGGRAVGALVYLAVFGTALTYTGLYWLVPRVPIAAIGAIPLLDTTVAVFLGAAVLDEPLGWRQAAGGVLVLAAAGLAGRAPPPSEAGAPGAAPAEAAPIARRR